MTSDRESLRRVVVDYAWRSDLDDLAERKDFSANSLRAHDIYYYRDPLNPGIPHQHNVDILTAPNRPGNGLVDLFDDKDNFIDLNFVMVGQYKPGSQYNALGGNDEVVLPNDAAKALLAGYHSDIVFQGGDGNDYIYGGSLNDSIQGGADHDSLDGGAGNDSLEGGTGNDNIWGGLGDDILSGNNNDDCLFGGKGQDQLFGGSGDDFLVGGDSADTLVGGDGNDYLDSGLEVDVAADTLEGGKGDDIYYLWHSGDIIIEKADEGIDIVHSRVTYSLGNGPNDNIENLTLIGTDDLNGTGNDLKNIITGNYGSNQIDGGAGNDHLYGGDGNDSLIGGLGSDELDGGSGNDHLSGGDSYDGLHGGLGDDVLSGGAGNDFIDGGAGQDILAGNAGIDSFGFDLDEGADSVYLADVIEDFEDGVDVLYEGALDKSKITFLNYGTDAVLFSTETNQYICVIKNCAGKISAEDFAVGP